MRVYPSQDDPEPGQHQQIIGISSEQSRSVEHIPTDPIYLGDETVDLDSDEQGPEVPAVITASEVTLHQATDVPFSWEQDSAVVPTDDADICSAPIDESFIAGDDTDSYKEEIQISTEDHGAYTCNICSTEIKDFRYTCVQCPDFDLCGACEARQAHATHYVLRIPGPRPQGEVSAMLRTIRRALLSDAIVHVGDGQQVDFEIKEEEDLEDPINVELTELTQDNTTKSDPNESLDGTIEAEQNSEQELQFEQMENKNYDDNSERNAESQNKLVVVGQKQTKSTEPSTIVLPTSAKIAITEPGRLTSTLYTTDQVRFQIPPMNLPKIDKDVKKRELLERLQGKRSKILEKRDDVPRNLEQRKSVPIILGQNSIETRILQLKSAPRKIIVPQSATRKMSQPIILKRRDLRKPDSNSPIEQNFSKASEEIESISKSSLNKRSIDQSIAVEYSKKMKVKEISLPPVPEDVMRQLEAKARVCLHKLRSADPQTQTALHTHDKKHSDSK
ncbi:hypothetical protein O0L34_g10887 [Tuta absoluta]|nr:hypothetical protein O0L34_g10887 [Tuta absoluta]